MSSFLSILGRRHSSSSDESKLVAADIPYSPQSVIIQKIHPNLDQLMHTHKTALTRSNTFSELDNAGGLHPRPQLRRHSVDGSDRYHQANHSPHPSHRPSSFYPKLNQVPQEILEEALVIPLDEHITLPTFGRTKTRTSSSLPFDSSFGVRTTDTTPVTSSMNIPMSPTFDDLFTPTTSTPVTTRDIFPFTPVLGDVVDFVDTLSSPVPCTFGHPTPPASSDSISEYTPTPTPAKSTKSVTFAFPFAGTSPSPSMTQFRMKSALKGKQRSTPPPLPPLDHPVFNIGEPRLSTRSRCTRNTITTTPNQRHNHHNYPPRVQSNSSLRRNCKQRSRRTTSSISSAARPSTGHAAKSGPSSTDLDSYTVPASHLRLPTNLASCIPSRQRPLVRSESMPVKQPADLTPSRKFDPLAWYGSSKSVFRTAAYSESPESFQRRRRARPSTISLPVTPKHDEPPRRISAELIREQVMREDVESFPVVLTRAFLFQSPSLGNHVTHHSHSASLDSPISLHDNFDVELAQRNHRGVRPKGRLYPKVEGDMAGRTPTKSTPSRRGISTPRRGTSSISKTLQDAETVSPSLLYPPPVTPTTNKQQGQSSVSKGKRKADEVEPEQGTPPDRKKEGQRATFADEPRPIRPSTNSATSSHAPSSYQSRKRAKLSSSTAPIAELPTASSSRAPTPHEREGGNTGSWSYRAGAPFRTPSRAASVRSNANNTINSVHEPSGTLKPRRSMSGASIPISALVSPHAPSVSRSSTFHMRDPHRPPKKRARTGWALTFADPEEPGSGSPVHAWLFFAGFVFFFLWWFAAIWKIPETRRVGGSDVEKAVVVDDPQVEHDARSWRLRCRIMSLISLFTYIPFIVLIAVFVPR